jgi:PAS domain S-box-containing protein
MELPPPIREFIELLNEETLAPGYLLVNDGGDLLEWGGDLDAYDVTGLEAGLNAGEHIAFLNGVLPLEGQNMTLPRVQTRPGIFVDIFIFRREGGVWILLLDATAEARRRSRLQQKAYDSSLHAADLEREGEVLARVNSLLETRVEQRTLQLQQVVQQLERELAEKEKAETALRESQMRFLSLYDANLIGITFWDESGQLTEANGAFLDLIGYAREDLVAGQVRWDRITGANDESDSDLEGKLGDTFELRPALRPFVRKDGRTVPLLFSAAPQKGSRRKMVCFALDISGYS